MSIEDEADYEAERATLRRAIQAVTWNASNYPAKVRPHILGQDVAPLTVKIADAVQAAGFRAGASRQPSEVYPAGIKRPKDENPRQPSEAEVDEREALRKRLSDIGAIRKQWEGDREYTLWVNAPLEIVLDEAARTARGEQHV